jgi:hypothetical protein
MQRNKSILSALIFMFFAVAAFAQREETVIGNNGLGFSGLWGGYKHQITQFGNTNSYVSGGFFGLEFGKALLVGWGSYELTDEVKWDQLQNQNFDMKWRPIVLQYGFKNHKPFHPQIGLDAGRGKLKLGDVDDRIFVVQPSVGVEINVFRWFHIGLDGGYRFVSDSSIAGLTDSELSGAFGQATLKFGYSWGRWHKKKSSTRPKSYEN